ncbi:MAG TPA: adenylate/guanylate cyclase domain-containing protein [Acidimicrobiia bacterium]|nr:adenylate/guanylate cyclase domain-containing protein [Acidimicrobiia bacterium]
MTTTFWDRLAGRTVLTGIGPSVEDPRFVAVVATVAFWGSALANLASGLGTLSHGESAWWFYVAASVVSVLGWVIYVGTGLLWLGTLFTVLLTLVTNGCIHASLGGYAWSGGTLMWGITLTIITALVVGRRGAVVIGMLVVVEAVVFGFAESALQARRLPPDPSLSTLNFVVAIVGNLVIVMPLLAFLLGRLAVEQRRAETLLLNVLPKAVASELKSGGRTRARRFETISVLFADIVGFTPMSADMDPEEMVERLNEVFTHFDGLTERWGAEKIRTIGDNYMVAAGVPTPQEDHAVRLAAMALEMRSYAERSPFAFRIGINSGPAVAGVIGTKKFQYDVWGDTVNTASRMESSGEAGRIQITGATRELLGEAFRCTSRGDIDVKGKGTMATWWLEGRAG